MITLLYTFKNKDIQRVKKSLDSLLLQTEKQFEVLFVDYGSQQEISLKLQELLSHYSFVHYIYSYHVNQPWSRSKAINIGLRNITTPYVFVSDIDMLFHETFVAQLYDLKSPTISYYFKVGFLNEKETLANKAFSEYTISYVSSLGAQGLSLFPTEALLAIRGYDEFFHFWGGEDEDVHARLRNNGLEVKFFDEPILLLHQWHPTYRSSLNKKLTIVLQQDRIARINQEHFRINTYLKNTIVNSENWGAIISKEQLEVLNKPEIIIELDNKKSTIDNLLFSVLRNSNLKILTVTIKEDTFPKTVKYKFKKLSGKSIPEYYTMKEVNDLILLHLVAFYNNSVYQYVVGDSLNTIHFTIQLAQ